MPPLEGLIPFVTATSVLVTPSPCKVYVAVILTSVTGGDATLYNGEEATSGKQVIRLEGIADQSTPVYFPGGVICLEGLYIDVGSDVTQVGVYYTPITE